MTKNNFMKKLLLPIIVVLITLSGCQKKVNFRKEKEYIKEKNNITYYKGTPFSGVFEEYFENGQLEVKKTYKEGKINGLYERYHENGQLKSKFFFKRRNNIWTL
jgi:antitoxin component YwqK of YwqJK toxin-antitoxin module